jgi:hypothetical protein
MLFSRAFSVLLFVVLSICDSLFYFSFDKLFGGKKSHEEKAAAAAGAHAQQHAHTTAAALAAAASAKDSAVTGMLLRPIEWPLTSMACIVPPLVLAMSWRATHFTRTSIVVALSSALSILYHRSFYLLTMFILVFVHFFVLVYVHVFCVCVLERIPRPAKKIGKLQMLQSGAVRLVTTDGRTYEVNAGMNSSFVQILSTVHLDPQAISAAAAAAAASAAAAAALGNSSSSAGTGPRKQQQKGVAAAAAAEEETAPSIVGSINLMGSVTKKLVLTPAHDIGERRCRAFSVTKKTDSVLPQQLGKAGGHNLDDGEDEEIEMMDS